MNDTFLISLFLVITLFTFAITAVGLVVIIRDAATWLRRAADNRRVWRRLREVGRK